MVPNALWAPNAFQEIASEATVHIIAIVILQFLITIVVMEQPANIIQIASLEIAITEYAVREVIAQVSRKDPEINAKE